MTHTVRSVLLVVVSLHGDCLMLWGGWCLSNWSLWSKVTCWVSYSHTLAFRCPCIPCHLGRVTECCYLLWREVGKGINAEALYFHQLFLWSFWWPRGGSLVHGDHKCLIYLRGRHDKIYWRCAKGRNCSGTVSTQGDEIVAVKTSTVTHQTQQSRQ